MTAQCLMTNCRNKAPDGEAMCKKHRDDTVSVSRVEWLYLNRRLGEARGLLGGWLALHHSQHERCRKATYDFLETYP